MTIENARKFNLNSICVPRAIDAALGEGVYGPHVPDFLYFYSSFDNGLKIEKAIKALGGEVLGVCDLRKWKQAVDVKRKRINWELFFDNDFRPGLLNEEDILFLEKAIQNTSCDREELRLFLEVQIGGRVARAGGCKVILRVYYKDMVHVKFLSMGVGARQNLVDIYDLYLTKGGLQFVAVALVSPEVVEPAPILISRIKQMEELIAFPRRGNEVERADLIMFRLNPDAKGLVYG